MAKKNDKNKGVNVEKINKMFQDAPPVEELFGKVVNETVQEVEEVLVENNMVGGKDMNDVKVFEEVMQDVKEEAVQVAEIGLDVPDADISKEFVEMVNKNIKGAIKFYANSPKEKVIPGKQVLTVRKLYFKVTGVSMNNEQLEFIKSKANSKQLAGMIHVLNVASKFKKSLATA